MIMNRDKSSLLLVENKDMEIYEDGENWCHREIFNEDGTLVEDNFECPDKCYKCGYWNNLVD